MLADYAYYRDVYGGTLLSEADFWRLGARVALWLAQATRGRARGEIEAVRMAACAVAEALARQEQGGGIAAESVGSHRVEYEAGAGSQSAYEAARPYLEGAGLLYRGI